MRYQRDNREWAAFMDQARERAEVLGERVRVVGFRSPRYGWQYVISCGSACPICRSAR